MTYQNVLKRLHEEANSRDSQLRAKFTTEKLKEALIDHRKFYHEMKDEYHAIDANFRKLLYMSARMASAKTIVEFGTSFGISTIYLAAVLRDNGGGKLITTEYEPSKIVAAKANVEEAGLSAYVEFRQDDALETLKNFEGTIDILCLDGAKPLYVPVLKMLEPSLRSGAFIASDN